MTVHDRDEVLTAFQHHYRTGFVFEDWTAWARLFTDDGVFQDSYFGRFRGPDEIQRCLESVTVVGKYCYTVLDWVSIDGDRVVWSGTNKADHPDPSQPPFTFPSMQVLEYAGEGRWRSERDWFLPAEMRAFAIAYFTACAEIDPSFPDQLSRREWGEVDWARPPADHVCRPSWFGREHEITPVRSVKDITFGERL